VQFTGRLTQDELVKRYSRAKIAVVPSLYEGFGLPAAEAMACGTPVIATTGGALPEVVGDAGVLVPPRSADALADAIKRLLNDKRFNWRQAARKTLGVYEEVLTKR